MRLLESQVTGPQLADRPFKPVDRYVDGLPNTGIGGRGGQGLKPDPDIEQLADRVIEDLPNEA